MAVAAKPFTPPAPAFGPGSVAYIQARAEGLELLDGNEAKEAPAEPHAGTPAYAGAGAYF